MKNLGPWNEEEAPKHGGGWLCSSSSTNNSSSKKRKKDEEEISCVVCGKKGFGSWKAYFGHPDRNWRGAFPPPIFTGNNSLHIRNKKQDSKYINHDTAAGTGQEGALHHNSHNNEDIDIIKSAKPAARTFRREKEEVEYDHDQSSEWCTGSRRRRGAIDLNVRPTLQDDDLPPASAFIINTFDLNLPPPPPRN